MSENSEPQARAPMDMNRSTESKSELLSLLEHIRSTQGDLSECGTAVVTLLNRTFTLLQTSPPQTLAVITATALLRLSDEKISSFPYQDVPTCWRRLYTDATLLKVIGVLREDSDGDKEKLLEAVKDLDMALIVAGSPGELRPDHIFTLIRLAQSRLRPTSCAPSCRPTKRSKPSPSSPLVSPAPPVHHPILTISSPPSLDEFLNLIQTPFILSSGCSSWPALSTSPWASTSYLRSVAGPGRVVPVEVGGDYTTSSWSQRILPFDEFLDCLYPIESLAECHEPKEKLYLAQHDLFRQLPALERDIAIPDYVYSSPPSDLPSYTPPNNDAGFIVNAWLGPAGTCSPAHTDPYFNCYAQVGGSKWIWVAPPKISPFMYTYGPSNTEDDEEEVNSSSHYMTNTSRVDVTAPVDKSRFPKFTEEVAPIAQQAVLSEGDLLFMPPGWWHSMKSLEVSFSVSIWF